MHSSLALLSAYSNVFEEDSGMIDARNGATRSVSVANLVVTQMAVPIIEQRHLVAAIIEAIITVEVDDGENVSTLLSHSSCVHGIFVPRRHGLGEVVAEYLSDAAPDGIDYNRGFYLGLNFQPLQE